MMWRERRGQALLLGLLTCTVAAAVTGLAAAHAYDPSPRAAFGSARQLLRLDGGAGPAALRGRLAAARTGLAPAEVIAHRSVPVPGSLSSLDIRAQEPHGRYGAARLRLLTGRFPVSVPGAGGAGGPGSQPIGEIALTRSAAAEFHARQGATVVLGGRRFAVVGLVENPARLADSFALAPPGPDPAVVAGRPAVSAEVLTDAPAEAVDAFRRSSPNVPVAVPRRQDEGQAQNGVLVLAMATVALLLVALVAAAGFAVTAHRRLRHVGVLTAIGASRRHVRLVLVGHGALTGLAGTAAGAALGVAVWVVLAPRLEHAAGHRVEAFALPWPLLGLLAVVGVAGPTLAAWWPGRALARVPAARALSARPPRPLPGGHSVRAAAVLLAGGACCLVASHRTSGPLVVAGILGVVGGILLASPQVVRAMASSAARMPFAARLVLRDLGRHQARSGAALAAVTLAIGIPVAVSALASANAHTAATGNLSARQLLLRTSRDRLVVPPLPAAEVERRQAAVERYASALGGSATALEMAYDPAVPPAAAADGSGLGQPVLEADRPAGPHTWAAAPLYVATPAAARAFGVDPAAAGGADALTQQPGGERTAVLGMASRDAATRTVHVPGGSAYTSRPTTFLTPASVARHGWRTVTVGWFVSLPRDVTAGQRSAARDLAAANGLLAEFRDEQDGLRTLRWASVAAGAALALAVLAMTVGTLRAESADDLRTLAATGASTRTRRGLSAATAGSLALAGALLGGLGAYAVLLAAFRDDLARLAHVPWLPLLLAFPGLPLLATTAGWLTAGHEPRGVTRRVLE